eukprot:11851894-Alexandrium_andersonii.AAC.1
MSSCPMTSQPNLCLMPHHRSPNSEGVFSTQSRDDIPPMSVSLVVLLECVLVGKLPRRRGVPTQ